MKEDILDIKQNDEVIAQIRVTSVTSPYDVKTVYGHLDVIIPSEHDQTRINMRMIEWFVKKYYEGPVHIATIHWEGPGRYKVVVVKAKRKALKKMEMEII